MRDLAINAIIVLFCVWLAWQALLIFLWMGLNVRDMVIEWKDDLRGRRALRDAIKAAEKDEV